MVPLLVCFGLLSSFTSLLFVQGACIKGEKIFTSLPNANNTLKSVFFKYNEDLRELVTAKPDVFKVNFIPSDSFSLNITFQHDNTKYNFSVPDINYNQTALATSLSLSTIVFGSGANNMYNNPMAAAAIASVMSAMSVSGNNRMEAAVVAGALMAAMTALPVEYASAQTDACPLRIIITFKFIPGRWAARLEKKRDHDEVDDKGKTRKVGEIEFKSDDNGNGIDDDDDDHDEDSHSGSHNETESHGGSSGGSGSSGSGSGGRRILKA